MFDGNLTAIAETQLAIGEWSCLFQLPIGQYVCKIPPALGYPSIYPSYVDQYLQAYTEASRLQTGVDTKQLQAMEGQLTWLIHIIGAIIRGRQSSSSSAEPQEIIDGELAARVFQLIQVTDTGSHLQRYSQSSKQRLDLAILAFFQNFRRVYVGDQAMHSSKQLYARLNELLGLQDHLMVLNVIVGKIATNLKCLCPE